MGTLIRTLDEGWRRVRSRLSDRGDTEHEQALIRLAIVSLLLLYATLVPMDRPPATPWWIPTVPQVGYVIVAVSCLHFFWIVADPAVRHVRRAVWMVIDHAAIVLAMAVGGEPMALLYPLLLWVTLGHGFRYGPRHLLGSAVISVALFAPLVLLHPFWQTKGAFGIGLILGLVLIPGYCYRLLRHLHDARRRAEASSEAKSRFLATMSHELRTPLHAILGMTDLLRGTRLAADQRDMTRTVHTAGSALLSMIEDILDLARIEAGAAPSEIERFDVHRLLHEIRDMLGYSARTKGLALSLRLDPDLPAEVVGPKRALQQILINLVANAVKFTERGEVRIQAAVVRPRGSAALEISVTDTGCGIPPAAHDRIFESFTQVDETTTRRHGGSGLGLAIVKRLVDAYGGAVRLSSEVDRGTRFEVRLPVTGLGDLPPAPEALVIVHGEPTPAQAETLAAAHLRHVAADQIAEAGFASPMVVDLWCQPEPPRDPIERHGRDLVLWGRATAAPEALVVLPEEASVAQIRRAVRAALVVVDEADGDAAERRVHGSERSLDVLVADDHRINQQVIARLLTRAGHRAVVVDSGEAVLRELDRAFFDVVVLDLNMPGMGGLAVARGLSRSGQRPRLVALTADATTGARDACLAAGFDSFLTKPVDGTRLLAALHDRAERPDEPEAIAPGSDATGAAVLDRRRIAMLRELGDDDDFVREIIDGFIADGRALIAEIKDAAASGDVGRFRDAAHALRSSATHLGATALFEQCLSAKSLGEEELRAGAVTLGVHLDAAFAAASSALMAERDAGETPPSAKVHRVS